MGAHFWYPGESPVGGEDKTKESRNIIFWLMKSHANKANGSINHSNGFLPNSLKFISSCIKTASSGVRSASASVAASISGDNQDQKDQVGIRILKFFLIVR